MRRGRELARALLRDRAEPSSYAARFRAQQLQSLVECARPMFPGNILALDWNEVDSLDLAAAERRVRDLIHQRVPIVNAWVHVDDCACTIPFLIPAAGGAWEVAIVHAAARTKSRHLQEAAFARFCLTRLGYRVSKVMLLSASRDFVRGTRVEPELLFVSEDISIITEHMHGSIEAMVAELRDAIDVPISSLPLCGRPDQCTVCRTALSELPRHNVFTLYHGGDLSRALFDDDVIDLQEVDGHKGLSERQKIQIECVRSGRPHLDEQSLRRFLSSIAYPLSVLDFETYSVAVPPFPGLRPWQHVPFQYSLDLLEHPDDVPVHRSYIEAAGSDGRRELVESLLSFIYPTGSVLVFGSNFERSMLVSLAESFPEYRSVVDRVVSRIVDLSLPFQSFWYYHPEQRGRMSLKAILPALTGEGYEELAFSDGLDASVSYYLSSHGRLPPYGAATDDEAETIRHHLETYCALDTGGLVSILRILETAVGFVR